MKIINFFIQKAEKLHYKASQAIYELLPPLHFTNLCYGFDFSHSEPIKCSVTIQVFKDLTKGLTFLIKKKIT